MKAVLRPEAQAGKKSSALLLDDGGATGVSYLQRLQAEGYDVTRAPNATAALELARQGRPNMIFVRLGRHGSGSLAFIAALRANDDTRHIPVAILASYYDPAVERLGLTAVSKQLW